MQVINYEGVYCENAIQPKQRTLILLKVLPSTTFNCGLIEVQYHQTRSHETALFRTMPAPGEKGG
jgi:hypothetical protein